jgi:hypothetical protein
MSEFTHLINLVPFMVWTGFIGIIIGALLTILVFYLANRSNNERLKIQLQHEENTRSQELMGVYYINRSNVEHLKIQLHHEQSSKSYALLREKAEELYIESKQYLEGLAVDYLPYTNAMKGEITLDQAMALNLKNHAARSHEFNRVTMIINMYFFELEQPFKDIMAKRDHLNTIIDRYKTEYKTGDVDGNKWSMLFQAMLNEYDKKVSAFEMSIASLEINA